MSARIEPRVSSARRMSRRDISDVHAIERAAYEFPWSPAVFTDCLRVGYSAWVLEVDSCIRGYGIMSIAAGESHILNLCICPRQQRRGLGGEMLQHLRGVASRRNASSIFLEVRPSNQVAIRLYERHGFRRVGTRPGYYPRCEGREDAYVYILDIKGASRRS